MAFCLSGMTYRNRGLEIWLIVICERTKVQSKAWSSQIYHSWIGFRSRIDIVIIDTWHAPRRRPWTVISQDRVPPTYRPINMSPSKPIPGYIDLPKICIQIPNHCKLIIKTKMDKETTNLLSDLWLMCFLWL